MKVAALEPVIDLPVISALGYLGKHSIETSVLRGPFEKY